MRNLSICFALVVGVVLFAAGARAASTAPVVITGADRRDAISLDGDWGSIVDPYQNGLFNFHHEELTSGFFKNEQRGPGDHKLVEYDFAKSPKLKVPGDWNTQRESLLYYEGLMWYERDFAFTPKAHHRVFLHVGAANYHSWFWVNGARVCEHEGGYTAFNCEVTSLLHAGGNFVVAAVDNTRHADDVPTLETDWWNYGGLHRSVSLLDVPEAFIDQYDVHLSRTSDPAAKVALIEGWAHVEGAQAGATVRVQIPELHAESTAAVDENHRAKLHMEVSGLERWSPESPRLYKVKLTAGDDAIEELMGFRTIETRGSQILLNGKPVFLKGISIHAEAPYRTGRANTAQDAETLLGWAKELGCNFVRLAHYPHDESMLRAADRMGLMVWSENPVYWALQFDNPKVYAKAETQLDEEIGTSRNHASIVLWSMANETPINTARTAFITKLAQHARALDDTRLITAALLSKTADGTKILDDPLGSALDVLGVNEYIGWYEGSAAQADKTTWRIAYDKPLFVSEFGAGARAGLHGKETDRWTEECQANVYRHQIVMLNNIGQLRGMSPWILMDFRSPRRQLSGIQDGFNRKGLISEKGEKKAAFDVLRQAYTENRVGKAE